MIYVTNQLFKTHPEGIEQQFAACSGLSQSISEEFDRSAELHAQTVQQTCESWGQFYSTAWQVKDPQEFFMLLSTHLHASAEQTQHYWHALHSLTQQIQEKMFALEQTFSPMITETIIDLRSDATSRKLAAEPKITKKAVTTVYAKTVPVKPGIKSEVTHTANAKTETKTKAKTKPDVKVLPAIELAPAASIKPKVKVQRTKTTAKPAEAEVQTAANTAMPPETTPQGQTSEKNRNTRSRRNQS